jgi:uncharacterized protein (DUF2147 family)
MNNRNWWSYIFAITVLFSSSIFAAMNSPVGYWKTVDDKTGKVLSIVQIYPVGNTLEGRVVRIMPVLGQKPTEVCEKCKGSLHNKPIMGMRIIWGMHQVSADTWTRGQVLDPKSGKTYQATLKLVNNGANLKLRGYVGLPTMGRSQTWARTTRR